MANVVRCPGCGEVARVPACSSCGAELLTGAADHVRDRAASDREQTAGGRDQTGSDRDQTWADRDQTASDSDQRSADQDQQAADDGFASGSDAATYHLTSLAREQSSHDRDAVSALRDESADGRLETADERDRAAAFRDHGAEVRDVLDRMQDHHNDGDTSREDVLVRAERARARAATDRAQAAEDRARAAADREEAARERAAALKDRTETADTLRFATTDDLTGAWTRKFGLEEVARELERAHRTHTRLELVFVDVDGLKQVNDSEGHPAGDALLRLVGETLRANVRPYDVVVRYGGDELVCAMPNLTAPEARERFDRIAAILRAVHAEHSVSYGLAEAEPADSLQELIARADADLLERRRSRSSTESA